MTELYLKKGDDEYTKVVFEASQGFKLTRENPYFTSSDTYTMEVTLPMEILANRMFFENLHRIERTKRPPTMKARLLVNNSMVLDGSAKVTQVSESAVKVQLLGGNSEINFLSKDSKIYIDEMEIPYKITSSLPDLFPPREGVDAETYLVYDETQGKYQNHHTYYPEPILGFFRPSAPGIQPNLMQVTHKIFEECGYTVIRNDVNVAPWNRLLVANAKYIEETSHVLPHWLVSDFVKEFCNFFNCTLVVDQREKTVSIVSNMTFFSEQVPIELQPVEEYTAEVSEEGSVRSMASDTIAFDMSGSSCHDYDCIDDSIRDNAPQQTFSSKAAALEAYNAKSAEEKDKMIYVTPVGRFTGWKHDYSDVNGSEENMLFTQIDVFGPLKRNSGNEIALKIVPVAIGDEPVRYYTIFDAQGGEYKVTMRYPSLENPTGNDVEWMPDDQGQVSKDSIQDMIEGSASIEKPQKEDRLQVMFYDDVMQTVTEMPEGMEKITIQLRLPFTDWQYKKCHSGNEHLHWSLSLNPTEADHYLGELHRNSYSINVKSKETFKFLADAIPSVTGVFIIRGKRYACEKIEANVTANGVDRLMTGYFYEMTSD